LLTELQLYFDCFRWLRYITEGIWIREIFKRIASNKPPQYALGPADSFEALEGGSTETLLLHEDTSFKTITCVQRSSNEGKQERKSEKSAVEESSTGEKKTGVAVYFHVEEKRLERKLKELKGDGLTVIEVVDFVDWALEHAADYGAKVQLLSVATPECIQFKVAFGGIAALTRYAFHPARSFETDLGGEEDDDSSSSSSDDDEGDAFFNA
jgi:peptide subunit release factor 1 (eRF1)